MDSLMKSESGFSASSERTKNDAASTVSSAAAPSKRRPRHRLSCAECRRLKLKCDRTWPCSSCTKRGCARICPEGTLQSKVRTKDTSVLLARISELENLLQQKEHEARFNRRDDRQDGPPFASRSSSDHPRMVMGPPPGQPQDPQVLALIDGIGTLNVSNDGRSRFLGLSASSTFFDGDSADCHSIYPTPATSEDHHESSEFVHPFTFQALIGNPRPELRYLKTFLPDRHEAEVLSNAYYSFVSHLHELLSRAELSNLLTEVYNDNCNEICIGRLALLYSLFSLSVLFNPAVPPLHSDARKWHNAAEICLKSTDYLSNPSLATLQSIHAMGIYMLNSQVDGAEIYWPVLGTAMRLCQSMGLHRDGSNWGLEASELEARRRAFHEILFLDRLQSLVLGRPYSISEKHFDTLTPRVKSEEPENNADFHVAKWRFSSYIGRVVDDAFSVTPPSLADVNRLDEELREFDRGLPAQLKCSSASPISKGPCWCDQEQCDNQPGISDSCELQLTMQQHFMSSLENTTLLFLHRRAFALALTEAAQEPVNSKFSKSVVAVIVESSRNLVHIAQAAQTLYPDVASRWWHIFCHAYNGATCVATLLIKSPRCMLVKHAWSTLSTAMSVFSVAAEYGPLFRDLINRLNRLHKHAVAMLSASTSPGFLGNCERLSTQSHHQNQIHLPSSLNNLGERSFGLSLYLEPFQSNLNHSLNDFPGELGASTRLTRKNRTQSISNSSVASGRNPSQTSSCGSRDASSASTGPKDLASVAMAIGIATSLPQGSAPSNNRSPIDNDGIHGTLTTPFNKSSWAGLINSPRDEFDDEESTNPPCWENLSVEPGDEPFRNSMFNVPHSQPNYFEGFTEQFHPPMALPPKDVMLSPSASNFDTIFGPMPNPTSFDNHNTSHAPLISANHVQSEETPTSNELITSPTSAHFDLLDTFLTW